MGISGIFVSHWLSDDEVRLVQGWFSIPQELAPLFFTFAASCAGIAS